MTKQKRNIRTPEQLIEEAEARIAKLREKQAMEQAKTSPEVACVVEALNKVNKGLQESSKLLGNSPQSCNVRREKHELWIAEIDAAEKLARTSQDANMAARESLQSLLTTAMEAITSDSEFDAEQLAIDASTILAQIEENEEISKASNEYDQSRWIRQAFGSESNDSESEAAN